MEFAEGGKLEVVGVGDFLGDWLEPDEAFLRRAPVLGFRGGFRVLGLGFRGFGFREALEPDEAFLSG